MECPYFMTFKWPHIAVLRDATVMVGYAGSRTHTVYVDVTLT